MREATVSSPIVVIGDSIVTGHGLPDVSQAWPRLLLDNRPLITTPTIQGYPGITTTQLLDGMQQAEPMPRFDTALLAVGLNDARIQPDTSQPEVTLADTENNLRDIIGFLRASVKNIYVIGLTNVVEGEARTPKGDYSNLRVHQYDLAIAHAVSDSEDVAFIPVFGALGKEHFSDGIHPNALGHSVLRTHILKQLAALDPLFER